MTVLVQLIDRLVIALALRCARVASGTGTSLQSSAACMPGVGEVMAPRRTAIIPTACAKESRRTAFSSNEAHSQRGAMKQFALGEQEH
jgi:hypothetical protein